MQLAMQWMKAEKAGYKRAAKKYGVDESELRAHARAPAHARAGEEAPAAPPDDEAPAEADGLAWTPARRVLAAPRASHTVRALEATATEAVAGLVRGGRLVGLTSGQFSLLDLIRALLDLTGPAEVLLSTWTAGIRDVETAAWLLGGGQIRSLRILTDRSFPTRQPKYCRRLVELFGADCLVVTRTHAKFAVIQNDEWTLAVRSSMNLNKNTRWEQFDVDDDPVVAALFRGFAEEVAAASGTGIFGIETNHTDEAFEQVLAAERKIRRREARTAEPAAPIPSSTPDAATPPGPPLVEFYRGQIVALKADLVLARGEEKWSDVTKLTSQLDGMVKTLADLEALASVRIEAAPEGETEGERLRREVTEITHSIALARARARPDAQGLSALYRLRAQTEAALSEALRAEQQVPTTPEQLGAAVSEIVDQWPDDLLERAVRVYATRHKGEIEMVRGERRARLGPDGWEAA